MVRGEGPVAATARQAIEENYARHIFDEMIPPTVIVPPGGHPAVIADNDAVINFNFRPDRALQLARALCEPKFDKFSKSVKPLKNLLVVTMTEYARDLGAQVAFPPVDVHNGLTELISQKGLRQFHIAESEKYAHVSVFFNGGVINPFPGEDREIITSPASNYQNYVDVPEMSAFGITDALLGRLKENYSFFLVNFANPDMVGHTGNVAACVAAIDAVDKCLKRLLDACLEQDICMLITADHGNIEELVDIKSGGIDKEHSTNPVPLILAGKQFEVSHARTGGIAGLAGTVPVGLLSDVAPTVLELMGLEKPAEMTGVSLLPQLLKRVR
jgi:2,3-bisphosphoglycerate-independent phosphoglycerate mutase